MSLSNEQLEADVELYKEFLRINTMHPNPNLGACVEWLKRLAKDLGMTYQEHTFVDGLPIVIVSKIGTEPQLPSLGLNCHMDVVPVVADKWTALPDGQTPFTAWEDSDGRIYARGSQDMKCVGAQYLCALRRMSEMTFRRTVHTIWVPDEEIGGQNGMRPFVESPAFKALNLGCCLDEGLAHEEDKFVVYYGERSPMWIQFTAIGDVGHASKLIPGTAMDRLARVVEAMTKRRDANVRKLAENPNLKIGDVTSINFTMASGGTTNDGGKTYAFNVIPSEAKVAFDVRVCRDDYHSLMDECRQLAEEYNLRMDFMAGKPLDGPSQLSSTESVWCKTLEHSLAKWGCEVEKTVFPAATDSRYLRHVGTPAFGFSPMRKTPSLLHDHNEYLTRATYLEGVEVYVDVIRSLANVAGNAKL